MATTRNIENKSPLPTLVRDALDKASKEDKLVLLDFYASWCGPCKRMSKETLANPTVAKELERFIVLKVDTDKNPEISKWYGVAGIPDVRILAADGTELDKIIGFKPASEFQQILAKAKSR